MKDILDKILPEYNFGLDSRISDITLGWDYVAFIMECELHHGFEINDDEAIFFEEENLSFQEIEDFFLFLKNGSATPFVHALIANNINRLKKNRPEYESYIVESRDRKIRKLGL